MEIYLDTNSQRQYEFLIAIAKHNEKYKKYIKTFWTLEVTRGIACLIILLHTFHSQLPLIISLLICAYFMYKSNIYLKNKLLFNLSLPFSKTKDAVLQIHDDTVFYTIYTCLKDNLNEIKKNDFYKNYYSKIYKIKKSDIENIRFKYNNWICEIKGTWENIDTKEEINTTIIIPMTFFGSKYIEDIKNIKPEVLTK